MAVTKKTPTTKPAAKKTAAAKPVAKKTTATKPAVKKTTAAKPAAKATPSKATTTSSSGLSVRGNKKIETFQIEFNKKFPYLGILFFNRMGKELKGDKTFGEIAGAEPGGSVSISGNKHIGNLEADFLKAFNIKVQVFWTSKENMRIITSSTDSMTLARLNALCEKDNEMKGVWH